MRRIIFFLLLIISANALYAQVTLQQATTFFQSGDYAKAKTADESILASNPAPELALTTRVNLAVCNYFLRQYDAFKTQAMDLLKETGLSAEDNEMLRFYLAMTEAQKQNWAEAKRMFLDFLASSPKSADRICEAKYQAAMCAYSSGSLDEFRNLAPTSISLLDSQSSPTVQTRTESEVLRYHFAISEYQMSNWSQAKTLLIQFIDSSPQSAEMAQDAKFHAAMAAVFSGDDAQFRQLVPGLLKEFDRETSPTLVIRQEKESVRFHYGMSEYRQGNWSSAKQLLLQVIAENPATDEMVFQARFHAAMAAYNANEYDQFRQLALPCLDASTSATQSQIENLRFILSVIPFRQSKWDEAIAAMDDFVAKHPASPLAESAQFHATLAVWNKRDLKSFGTRASAYLSAFGSTDKDHANTIQSCCAESDYMGCNWQGFRSQKSALAACGASPAILQSLDLRDVFISYWQENYDDFLSRGAEFLTRNPNASLADQEQLRSYMALSFAMKGSSTTACDELQRIASESKSAENVRVAKFMLGRALMQKSNSLSVAGDTTGSLAAAQQAARSMAEMRADAATLIANAPDEATAQGLEYLTLESFYYQGDFAGLASTAASFCAKRQTGTPSWGNATVWMAIGKMNSTEHDYAGAAQALDAVLAANIDDPNIVDHIPTQAAFWRVAVAQLQGDTLTARTWAGKIQTTMPSGPVKERALAGYATLVQPD